MLNLMLDRLLDIKIKFFLFLLLCLPVNSYAVPAMGMGYAPKYSASYKHFDYVNPAAPKQGDLTMMGLGTFDSLNPYLLKGLSADGLGTLVFESLLEKSLDEPFSEYGLIADDFYLADDELSVTFHINPLAKFSDGKKIKAEDIKYSFDTLMSKAAHPQFRVYYADVKSATVIDNSTVRFDFKNKNRELHMIIGEIPIFSKKWAGDLTFDKTDDTKPIASGPYIVEKYSRGKSINYVKNPNYWARDLPVRKGMFNYERVTYKYYKDSTIALEAFKAGEFDFFFENYSKRWARSHNGPRYDSGEIIKTELTHQNNAGMQGFAFNTRRDKFKDVRVRRALALAYDFEWANDKLFYNQYVRADSYFSNSELAAQGLPEEKELALLEKYRDQLPAEIFTQQWKPATTITPSSLRKNLIQARDLLAQAGWTIQKGVLKNKKGEVFKLDILLVQNGFDRIIAPYAHNLKKLGIETSYRKVDSSLYKRRMDTFEFDMVVNSFPSSVSPGNELMNMFHSSSAKMKGSRNMPGINNPVVDALVLEIIQAKDREQVVIASRALDRVLLYGEYLVPNWYINVHRVAYWNKFGIPKMQPLYYDPISWVLKAWWINSSE
ncbi:ABC transporter, substrate-binding protein (cluster 5, nickel/peptides/opines) [hydrothermal vent metagenome]|uniref:ABC transporter, substrate-binding protein (Cluster 5, nickel/peptides/opines) n=1 Tax=hydrothermal vent metagenome TaxID=652676 RepID=A0A3B0X6K2_9ZZZZ